MTFVESCGPLRALLEGPEYLDQHHDKVSHTELSTDYIMNGEHYPFKTGRKGRSVRDERYGDYEA